MTEPIYFDYNEKMDRFLKSHRGFLLSLCVQKADETERVLSGILCLSKKGVPMISESDDPNTPNFKQINVNKIKWIMLDGCKHYPKGNKNEHNK